MAQSSNRFGLDEVNTQLTAPTSNVQVQGPMDTSLTTSTRSSGIKNFSDALGGLAKKKLAQKIHNDTIDAQLASAINKEQPGGLEPEAVHAFRRAEDLKAFANIKKNMANYSIVEASALLNNPSLTRKEKYSQIQAGQRAIMNTGLQSISPVNNIDLVPALEGEFNRLNLLASADLAKQKKEEESSINGAATMALVGEEYDSKSQRVADMVTKDSTIATDDDRTPTEIARIQKMTSDYISTQALSVPAFNKILNFISSTKVGADTREIKATILTAMTDRMLKAIEEGDFSADPRALSNLLDGIKGNPQSPNSTLRTEIGTGTDYGKIFKTIADGYRSNLKTLLSSKRTLKNQAVIDADNKIGNDLFDNKDNFTQKQGQDMLLGMSNFKSQLTALKRWDALFDDSALNGPTSPAYLEALIGGDDVLTSNGRRIDDIAFSKHVIEHHLNGAAQTELRKRLDPESKESKHRTKVLENNTVKLLLGKFRPAVKAQLQILEMDAIIAEFFQEGQKGALPPTPLILAGIAKKFSKGSQVYKKSLKILNAELTFSKELESLILSNPDKEAAEIAELAEKRFSFLFTDVVSDVPIGETENLEKKSILEKRLEVKRKLSLGEPAASGAVTKELSPAQEKQKIEVEKKAAVARVLADVKDPDTMIEYVAIAAKQFEAEQAVVVANHKMNGTIPATRREKMGIISKFGGTPTGRDGDIKVSEKGMAAIATNPEAALILRAKVLQRAEEKEIASLSKNVFTFRTEKQMLKNQADGKELLRIGNLQYTTDDFANFTLDNVKEFPGNVGFYLGQFMDSLRVFNKDFVPEKRPVSKPQITVEQPKITDKRSVVQKAAEGITKTIGALTLAGDAGAAGTSQDANFDPDAPGPRGFNQDNKPQEGTRNELAQALGLPPDLFEDRFKGGTSEESDIEGFTGEEMDIPPVVMDEIVVSETKPNRAQQRLEAFNQAFPDVPNERNALRGLQDTAKFKEDVASPKLLQQKVMTALKTIPAGSSSSTQIAKASMSIMPVLKLLAPAQTNVLQGYLTPGAPLADKVSYGGRGAFYSAQNALGLLSRERKQNLTRLENFVTDNAKAAFSQELKKISNHLGLGVDDLKEHMKLIYMSETNVGTNVQDSIPTLAGDRPAIGDLQVMATTFRDLIGKQFGRDAAGIAGLDYTELKKLKTNNDKDALEVLLRNRNVNFVASMAKMVQYLEVKANQTPTYKAEKAAKIAKAKAAAKIKKTAKKIKGK